MISSCVLDTSVAIDEKMDCLYRHSLLGGCRSTHRLTCLGTRSSRLEYLRRRSANSSPRSTQCTLTWRMSSWKHTLYMSCSRRISSRRLCICEVGGSGGEEGERRERERRRGRGEEREEEEARRKQEGRRRRMRRGKRRRKGEGGLGGGREE